MSHWAYQSRFIISVQKDASKEINRQAIWLNCEKARITISGKFVHYRKTKVLRTGLSHCINMTILVTTWSCLINPKNGTTSSWNVSSKRHCRGYAHCIPKIQRKDRILNPIQKYWYDQRFLRTHIRECSEYPWRELLLTQQDDNVQSLEHVTTDIKEHYSAR